MRARIAPLAGGGLAAGIASGVRRELAVAGFEWRMLFERREALTSNLKINIVFL